MTHVALSLAGVSLALQDIDRRLKDKVLFEFCSGCFPLSFGMLASFVLAIVAACLFSLATLTTMVGNGVKDDDSVMSLIIKQKKEAGVLCFAFGADV